MSETFQMLDRKVVEDYDLLRDAAALVELTDRSLFSLSGDDRKGWLQGQVTQDLRKLEAGSSTSFCFASQTGQTLSIADAWILPDQILFDGSKSTESTIRKRIEDMVILEEVSSSVVSRTHRLLSIQGPKATSMLSGILTLPKLDAGVCEFEGSTIYVFRSNRTGLGGWDLWIPNSRRKALNAIREAFPSIGLESFEVAQIEAGIPLMGKDVSEKTLPMELGPAFVARYVNLNKGCFVGQEVLQRIHSRGHTNRTWVGLALEESVEPGTSIAHLRNEVIGTVHRVGISPDYGPIATATIRNQAAFEGENVRVQSANGWIPAEVRMMPILRLD
jgi:folate-binding protein YgfZ